MTKKLKINLSGINIDQIEVHEDIYNKESETNISYSYFFKIKTPNSPELFFITKCNFFTKSEQKSYVTAQVSLLFDFNKEIWNSFIKEDTIVIPKLLAINIVATGTGVLRGVVASALKDTKITKLLPLINIDIADDVELIKKNR